MSFAKLRRWAPAKASNISRDKTAGVPKTDTTEYDRQRKIILYLSNFPLLFCESLLVSRKVHNLSGSKEFNLNTFKNTTLSMGLRTKKNDLEAIKTHLDKIWYRHVFTYDYVCI